MEYTWGGDFSAKTIARYNISWNDSRIVASNRGGMELYNNVFYSPGATLGVEWTAPRTRVNFRNNIFVAAGRSTEFTSQSFFNNTFNGGITRPTNTNSNDTRNPLFVNPNTTGYSIDTNGVVTISGTALPQRIAVIATSGSLTSSTSFGTAYQTSDWNNGAGTGKWNVTATNGIMGNTTAWGINLNGGTLTTPVINASDYNYLGAYLYFNGTTVRTSASNPAFVTLSNGTKANIDTGGANIDTDGHDIGIGIILANASSASPASNGGTTLISAGTLLLSEAGRLGSGTVTNNATLVFTLNSNLTVNTVISGSGSVTQSGAGVLTLSGGNSYTGNTSVTAGTLRLGNGTTSTNLANSADVLVSPGAMLDLNYTGTDQIRSLWVDGSQLPPGVYSSSFPFITGSGTTLSGWTDVSVVAGGMVAIQPETPQSGTDSITITEPEGTEPLIFGRLNVSTPPAKE